MNRSPYITQAPSVSSIMLKVLLALIPGLLAYLWVYGGGILVTLTIAIASALFFEFVLLKWRGRPVKPFLSDLSAVVTASLLALSIPPLAPWWLVIVGVFFAIAVAKHPYGGLGYNPFNPAMVGYAALLISFPILMTKWPAPLSLVSTDLSFLQQLSFIFTGQLPPDVAIDAVTAATPLDHLKTQLMIDRSAQSIFADPIYGVLGGKSHEIIPLAYLVGGFYLLRERIISWHLPVAFLSTLAVIALFMSVISSATQAGPFFHLMTGAAMFGAFFIITDPVSGSTTPKGKLVFAAGVGLLTWLIRVYGGYPDGVAFAVLLMNMCVPLIDTMTQPRVFGHAK